MRTSAGWRSIAAQLKVAPAAGGMAPLKNPPAPGAVRPATATSGVGVWPKVCYRYGFYSPAEPGERGSFVGSSLGGPTYDSCTPAATRQGWEFTAVEVCLQDAFTATRAKKDLERRLGAGWEAVLWDIVGLAPTDSSLDGNIAAAGAEPRWTTWSDAGYDQQVSDAPRRQLFRRVLSLIVEYQEGIPERIEQWRPRDAVVDQVVAGDMDYRIYAPWDAPGPIPGFDNIVNLGDVEAIEEWAVKTWVLPRICTGSRETFLGVDLSLAAGPAVGYGTDVACGGCWAYAVAEFGVGVTFRFQVGDPAAPISLGSNHGLLEDRVWFGQIELDRCATAYDWLVAQAIRHFAWSFREEDPVMVLRQLVAAQLCLRNALAVAALWGRTVVHESCHNENLYHCQTGAACAQDHAAYAWWVHVTARLGLPRADWLADDHESTGQVGLTIFNDQDFGLDPTVVPFPGARVSWPNQVECNQGTTAAQSDIDEMRTWGALAAVAAGLMGDPTLKVALADLSYYLLLGADELQLGTATRATLEFAIDTPLVPGGSATVCCIKGRDPACVTGGLGFDVPCWSSDPPSGAGGCCNGGSSQWLDEMDRATVLLGRALSRDDDATHGGRDE